MIELLLRLIDRIIDLKKYQAERIRKTFDADLEPLFNDLMAVHSDYIRMFEDIHGQVSAIPDLSGENGKQDKQELLKVAESLRQRRLEFEPVRAKLAAVSREMGRMVDGRGPRWECPEAEKFVSDVLEYFPRANLGDGKSRATALLALMHGASQITPAQVERHGSALPALIRSTIDGCRERWEAVCVSYAQLKMAVHAAQ